MAASPIRTRIVNTLLSAVAAGAGGFAALSYSRLPELAAGAQLVVYCVAPAAVGVLFCASLLLPFEAKANLLTAALSVAITIVFAEFALALLPVRHDPLGIEHESDSAPDTRSFPELVADLWDAGEQAYPHLSASKAREFRVTVAGFETFSLSGGLADTPTVLCNDSGTWQVYESDQHGFNNDRGAWDETPQVVLIGDSYTHGWCVDRSETIAAVLARRWPSTLNLGVSGSGPLAELAVLREFGAELTPRTILWLYYEGNDLADLQDELQDPILVKYMDGGFSQGTMRRQEMLDSELRIRLGAVIESSALSEHQLGPRNDTDAASPRLFRFARVQQLLLGAIVPFPSPVSRLQEFPRIMELAVQASRDWGGDFYFVYLPAYSRYSSRVGEVGSERREVLRVVERLGVPVIDIAGTFDTLDDPRSMWLRPTAHYTPAGYRLVAETIADVVSSRGRPRSSAAR